MQAYGITCVDGHKRSKNTSPFSCIVFQVPVSRMVNSGKSSSEQSSVMRSRNRYVM